MSDEKDPGIKGKKLSKSGIDGMDPQQKRLLERYYDLQIAWIRTGSDEDKAAYRKISDQYKAQYDR